MSLYMKLQGNQCTFGAEEIELVYFVQDTDGPLSNPIDARLWFRTNVPATAGPLVLSDINLDEVGPGIYTGTATYTRYAEPEAGETVGGTSNEWNFDFGLSNALETRSRETLSSHIAGAGDPIDFKGSINVTKEGVEGAEVPRPTSGFSETHYYDPSALTFAFKKALKFCVGKTNEVAFRGYDPGEVMLEAITGSGRGRENVQLSFKFAVSENADDLTVGPITGIEKPGHALVWVSYEVTEQGTGDDKVEIKTPKQVNVERMFEAADFESICGI